MNKDQEKKSVVYLIGAGATHGCVKFVGSARGVLMKDLNQELADTVRKLVDDQSSRYYKLRALTNEIIDESTDFEHVITFLDDSPSELHRSFAQELRSAFEKVLRHQLELIESESGDDRLRLYSALFDMHTIEGFAEDLQAVLTINYDEYIEEAVKKTYGSDVDFGVSIEGAYGDEGSVKLLKLHGSFGWADMWPISAADGCSTLWIPPGIQKRKERYPFNVLWGLARQALECDLLRIVGCRLSESDWDLISLLFTTLHGSATRSAYAIEVIDSPIHAFSLRKKYPYLNIKSILEIEEYGVGGQIVGEILDTAPKEFDSLSDDEHARVLEVLEKDENWFSFWLIQMAEALSREPSIDSIGTQTRQFEALLQV